MSKTIVVKRARRQRRKQSIRRGLFGTSERPRMSVFRSAKHIYVQIINDFEGRTLVSSSTKGKDFSDANGGNCDAAKKIGEEVAQKALDAGIKTVVFDRNGYRFHGRVKALADAAREKGLVF